MMIEQLAQRIQARAEYPPAARSGGPDVRGVTTDPGRAGPATVFAALPALLTADPLGIHIAAGLGAPAVICAPGAYAPAGLPRLVVAEPDRALAGAASALHGDPLAALDVFRVPYAGRRSAGAASHLHSLLAAAGRRPALILRDLGLFGGRTFWLKSGAEHTTELHRLLAGHVRSGGDCAVIEDSEAVRAQLGNIAGRTETEVRFAPPRLVVPRELHWRGTRVSIRLATGDRVAHVPCSGATNAAALDAAFACAVGTGIDPEILVATLPVLPCAVGCLERVCAGQPFGVFVDAASEAADIFDLVGDVRGFARGSVILVLGAGTGTTAEERRLLGAAASAADRVVVTADNPGYARFAAIASDILQGATRAAQVERDRHRAIVSAIRQARTDDVVLVAGKALRPTQEIEGAIIPWDDRKHALEALALRGWSGDEL